MGNQCLIMFSKYVFYNNLKCTILQIIVIRGSYIIIFYHFLNLIADPRAPSLGIRAFPVYSKVILAGHNFSVACTSNKSKEYQQYREEAQPQEISMFYGNSMPIKVCGSADDPKRDTMSCTLVISNAALGSSGNYSCMASNYMRCTTATIFVKVEGNSLLF